MRDRLLAKSNSVISESSVPGATFIAYSPFLESTVRNQRNRQYSVGFRPSHERDEEDRHRDQVEQACEDRLTKED